MFRIISRQKTDVQRYIDAYIKKQQIIYPPIVKLPVPPKPRSLKSRRPLAIVKVKKNSVVKNEGLENIVVDLKDVGFNVYFGGIVERSPVVSSVHPAVKRFRDLQEDLEMRRAPEWPSLFEHRIKSYEEWLKRPNVEEDMKEMLGNVQDDFIAIEWMKLMEEQSKAADRRNFRASVAASTIDAAVDAKEAEKEEEQVEKQQKKEDANKKKQQKQQKDKQDKQQQKKQEHSPDKQENEHKQLLQRRQNAALLKVKMMEIEKYKVDDNDVKQINRHLDKSIYLMVKRKNSSEWVFPRKLYPATPENNKSISPRQFTKFVIRHICGRKINSIVFTNAPDVYYSVTKTDATIPLSKIFLFRSIYISGSLEESALLKECSEYAWFTKEEIVKLTDISPELKTVCESFLV